MNYANNFCTFSEDYRCFVPKVEDVLFRRLWLVCSEICGFLLFVLPIIKIPPHSIGVLAAYETRTAHLPDDSTPKIASFQTS